MKGKISVAKKTKKSSKTAKSMPAKGMAKNVKKTAKKAAAAKKPIKKPAAKPAKVTPIPEQFHAITPHLICKDAGEAMEFYKKAFGAKEVTRMSGPDGKSVMHGEMKIGGSILMIADEVPQMNCLGPASLGGTSVCIHHYVANADKTFETAVKAGATVVMPMMDMFWGDRYGKLKDPFGHEWSIASRQKILTHKQMQKAMDEAFKEMCGPGGPDGSMNGEGQSMPSSESSDGGESM